MTADAGPSSGRLSWEQVHRLEVTLRARAERLSSNGGQPLCPGCGGTVSPTDDQLRLAGIQVHTACICEAQA